MNHNKTIQVSIVVMVGLLVIGPTYSGGSEEGTTKTHNLPTSWCIPESPDVSCINELWYLENGDWVSSTDQGIFYRLSTNPVPFTKIFSYTDPSIGSIHFETVDPDLGLVIALETERHEVSFPEREPVDIAFQNLVTIDYKTGEKKTVARPSPMHIQGLRYLGTHDGSIFAVCNPSGQGMVYKFRINTEEIQTEPTSIHRFAVGLKPNRPLVAWIDRISGDLFWVNQDPPESLKRFGEVVMRFSAESNFRQGELVAGISEIGYIRDIAVSADGEELAILAFLNRDGYHLFRQSLDSSDPHPRLVKTGETSWSPKKVRYGGDRDLWLWGYLPNDRGRIVTRTTRSYNPWLTMGFVDPGAER